jgi:uncharacterized protein (UPF0147 family)
MREDQDILAAEVIGELRAISNDPVLPPGALEGGIHGPSD